MQNMLLSNNKKYYKLISRLLLVLIVAALVFTPLFSSVGFAKKSSKKASPPQTFTKTAVFHTTKKPFKYTDYKRSIKVKGHTYEYKAITYKQLSDDSDTTFEKEYVDLKKKSVPEYRTFKLDNKKRSFKLKEEPTYKPHYPKRHAKTETYDDVLPSEVSKRIKKTIKDTVDRNGKEVTIKLKKASQEYKADIKDFAYDKTMKSNSLNFHGIKLDEPIQEQSGYKAKLKSIYDLPSYYDITSAKWRTGVYSDDGMNYRDIHFEGKGELRNYTVVYKEPKASVKKFVTYSTTATYYNDAPSYKVRANVEYRLSKTDPAYKTDEEIKKDNDNKNDDKKDDKNDNKDKKEDKNDTKKQDTNGDGRIDEEDDSAEAVLDGEEKPSAPAEIVNTIVEKSRANPILAVGIVILVIALISILIIFKGKDIKKFFAEKFGPAMKRRSHKRMVKKNARKNKKK